MKHSGMLLAALSAVALVASSSPASAQIAPTDLPSGLPTASPTPTPTPTPTPSPTPSPSPGGGGHHHHHHDGNHQSHQGPGPAPSPTPSHGHVSQSKHHSGHHASSNKNQKDAKQKTHKEKGGYVNVEGGWNSDKLVNAAAKLFAQGRSDEWIAKHLFRPFPLEGPASFIDSWHFARYGPAPGEVRKHEGQDIFCNFGEPVLAVQTGVIDFHNDGLGGHVAHLTKPDGSFWYYAHLSGWNTKDFSDGDTVHAGDIIGYCGNSGDAAGGAPHLHFGHYEANGNATNPLGHLLHWLHEAKSRAGIAVQQSNQQHLSSTKLRTMQRRFGLSFDPGPIRTQGKVPSFIDPGDCSVNKKGQHSSEKAGADTACSIDPTSIESLLLD
jgi:murein DD-endopeptidase MepM/ murein hydrolase activator NlpD